MRYWKSFIKSGNPHAPDFIFRHCEAIDNRGCLERWDGKEWVEESDGSLLDHLYLGEPGARPITEQEAQGFIATGL